MNNYRFKFSILLLMSLMLAYPAIVQAQEAQTNEGWNFKIGPDFYAPFVSGEITMDSISGALANSLNYGGSLGFEAYSAKWSVATDLMFVNAVSDVTLPLSSREANFDGKFTLFGVYAMHRVANWFDIGLGGRLILVDADLFVDGVQQKDSKYPTGAPLIVYRFNIFESPKWDIRLRGDFGGFGVDSNWTYLVNPLIGYRFNKLFELYVGFRLLAFSYNNESTATEMDILMYGPKIGFFIHF